jgi:hypothetical protein
MSTHPSLRSPGWDRTSLRTWGTSRGWVRVYSSYFASSRVSPSARAQLLRWTVQKSCFRSSSSRTNSSASSSVESVASSITVLLGIVIGAALLGVFIGAAAVRVAARLGVASTGNFRHVICNVVEERKRGWICCKLEWDQANCWHSQIGPNFARRGYT